MNRSPSLTTRTDSRCPPATVRTPDGYDLACRVWGEGRPVVFVHSWALSSAIWDYQMLHLAERGLRCVAFDRRGHGRSDQPPSGYDMDSLADDLASVIETLGLEDATLVGHSMGGAEILRYVGRHGTGRVARIALVAPLTPFPLRTPDNPTGFPADLVAQTHACWAADFPQWIEDNKHPFFVPGTSPAMMDRIAAEMMRVPAYVALACGRALVNTDLRPDLAKVDRPTLVVHGTADVSAPLDLTGRPTAQGIRGAELKVYEGAPHGLFVTHMDRLNRDLADFIGSAGS